MPTPTHGMLARLAFRRRSISEDTYIRETKQLAAAAAASSGPDNTSCCRLLDPADTDPTATHRRSGDGVICSNEDLKAIVSQHKLRRSPAVSPTAAAAPQSSLESQCTVLQLSVSDDVIVHVTCGGGSPSPTAIDARPTMTSSSDVHASGGGSVTEEFELTANCAELGTDATTTSAVDGVDQSVPDGQADSVESTAESASAVVDDQKKACSTVPDVVYDEHGQTWDVYGADFDPEILGQAIQAYLEKIMTKKLQRACQPASGGGGGGAGSDVELRSSRDSCLCEAAGGRQGQRQIDRAIGFVMRFLCSSVRWRHQPTTTMS